MHELRHGQRRRRGESADGKALTAALVGWMENALPTGFKSAPKEMLVRLVGDDDAKLLGVKLDTDQEAEKGALALVIHFAEHLYSGRLTKPPFRQLAERLFHAIVRSIWDMDKGWSREALSLPPSLQKTWNVKREARAG